MQDPDVQGFYRKLLADHSHMLDAKQVDKLVDLLDDEGAVIE
jgi:hypothetical protein